MNELFQQFALVDALLGNWDGIRVRMGTLDPALEDEFAQIAQQLGTARSPEDIASLIDKLLDLTEETTAYDYVRELIARSNVSTAETQRGLIGEMAAEAFATADLARAANELARVETKQTTFLPVSVFFATNRKIYPEKVLEHRYAGEYVSVLSYGHAEVTIPIRVHKIGKIETPLFGKKNKERHVVLSNAERLDSGPFATLLAQEVHRAQRKELLIFLHGYNVTFEEAARRAAQFAKDMNFEGVVVLFSWPSAGATSRYFADEDNAAKSAEPLTTFLRELEGGPWSKVHLVAHSMGNRVLVSGLASRAGLTLPLSNVVLVAADLDTELFEQQFPKVSELVHHGEDDLITSYATNSDRALGFSRWFHKTNRVGRFHGQPFIAEGLETIDATAVDSSLLGHGYFSNERSVLTDIGLLLREGLSASARGLTNVEKKWWAFPK